MRNIELNGASPELLSELVDDEIIDEDEFENEFEGLDESLLSSDADLELDDEELDEERRRLRGLVRRRPRPSRFPKRPRRPRPRSVVRPVFRRKVVGRRSEPCSCPARICPAHGSEYIRWVQSALNQRMGLNLRVNGVIDSATRDALRRFQQQQGLPSDGIAGPDTKRALLDARSMGSSAATTRTDDATDSSDVTHPPAAAAELFDFGDERPQTAFRAEAHSKRCQCLGCRADRETADVLADSTELHQIPSDLRADSEDADEFFIPPVITNFFQIVIDGKLYPPPNGVNVKNFFASSVPRFKRLKLARSSSITALVIHETETSSLNKTVSTLQKKDSGAHFIVAPDGSVTQHGDLVEDYFKHANHYNCNSVGIEVVNPYHASRLTPPWKETLTARWVFGKKYIVPTPQQAETVHKLIQWLTKQSYGRLQIPRNWIAKQDNDFAMNRAPGTGFREAERKCNGPAKTEGILAHTNIYGSKHADGAWLVLYAYLRSENGYSPEKAYESAIALSQKVRYKPFMGKSRGSWVKLPAEQSGKPPSDDFCVRPRIDDFELDLDMDEEFKSCRIVPIAPEPRPGFFYTIKHKMDAKGLINLAARAYRAQSSLEQLKLAQHINTHIYNQRFWVRTQNMKSFPDGIISFLPRFARDIRAQADANKGAAPRGNAFATIYIPKFNKST